MVPSFKFQVPSGSLKFGKWNLEFGTFLNSPKGAVAAINWDYNSGNK